VNFDQVLKSEKVKNLKARKPVTVSKDMPFSQVIQQLQENKTGCAVVLEGNQVIGIFTEKDALARGLLKHVEKTTPIEKLMTKKPKVLDREDSLAVAIRLMNEGKYRHLPIVNGQKEFMGLVSVRDIVVYLAENFPCEVYNLPPDPHQISTEAEGA
jgi:CBS domain-containing protein